MTKQKFPPGWDAQRVQRLLDHYENISEEELVAEDEAAHEMKDQTLIAVPTDLVPAIRELLARKTTG